jgi:hypothetical protein
MTIAMTHVLENIAWGAAAAVACTITYWFCEGLISEAAPHLRVMVRGLAHLFTSGPLSREDGEATLGSCHVACRVACILGVAVAGALYFVIDAKDSLIQGVAIAVGAVWACIFALCYLRMRRSLARGGFAPDFMRRS